MSETITVTRILDISGVSVPDRMRHAVERLVVEILDEVAENRRAWPRCGIYGTDLALQWLTSGGPATIELACAAGGATADEAIAHDEFRASIEMIIRAKRRTGRGMQASSDASTKYPGTRR